MELQGRARGKDRGQIVVAEARLGVVRAAGHEYEPAAQRARAVRALEQRRDPLTIALGLAREQECARRVAELRAGLARMLHELYGACGLQGRPGAAERECVV